MGRIGPAASGIETLPQGGEDPLGSDGKLEQPTSDGVGHRVGDGGLGRVIRQLPDSLPFVGSGAASGGYQHRLQGRNIRDGRQLIFSQITVDHLAALGHQFLGHRQTQPRNKSPVDLALMGRRIDDGARCSTIQTYVSDSRSLGVGAWRRTMT